MIFGNPDNFAIYVDEVKPWSYPDFKEGIFCFILNNCLVPNNGFNISVTLGVYWGELKLLRKNVDSVVIENKFIFQMSFNEAYQKLHDMRYSDIVENQNWDNSFLIADMIDNSPEIYIVSYQDKVKLLYKNLSLDIEVNLDKTTLLTIINEALDWYKNQSQVP